MICFVILCYSGESRIQCTKNLALPDIDTRRNTIYCNLSSKPEYRCRNKNRCVPTKSGAIRIQNCIPEKNSTIAEMLLSFQRQGKIEPPIPSENISHLIFSYYEVSYEKGEKISFFDIYMIFCGGLISQT